MALSVCIKESIMSKKFDQEVEKSRVLIFGVSDNTEIKERIAPIYTEERIEQGKILYLQTYEAGKSQLIEQDEGKAATGIFKRNKKEVHEKFMKVRKGMRYFYKNDVELVINLKLSTQVPTNYAQWKTLIDITLSAIENRPEVQANVALLGITNEFISDLRAELPKLDVLFSKAEKEDGEAQGATETKNELFHDLQSYCSDLRECLGLFFDGDDRQKLEEVGIIVK